MYLEFPFMYYLHCFDLKTLSSFLKLEILIYIIMDLIYNKNIILENVVVAKNPLSLAKGLMFASKKRLDKGICLQFPNDIRKGAAITMFFCFYPYEILFVNSKFKVVDKVILNPWKLNYFPKEECMYVFESSVGTFKDINIGDEVKLK